MAQSLIRNVQLKTPGGSGGMSWTPITGNTTAVADNGYAMLASGNLTLLLPASPTSGDKIGFADALGMATTYTLLIDVNGKKSYGVAENIPITTNYSSGTLLYVNDAVGWIVITEIGADGYIPLLAKNSIINGDMLLSQRGTSFASIASGTYTLDRFAYYKSGTTAVHTVTQATDVPGNSFKNSLKIACTTADSSMDASDYCTIKYAMEGYDFRRFAGKEATLSFWIRSSKTGTMCVGFRNSGTDRCYIAEVSINTANTWEKKTVTLTFGNLAGTWNYTNGVGLHLTFALMCGSTYQGTASTWNTSNVFATSNQTNFCDSTSNDVYITGVQLELSDSASEFEFLPYSYQEMLCERYYQMQYISGYCMVGAAWDSGQIVTAFQFRTAMRTTPTISLPSIGSGAGQMSFMTTTGGYPSGLGSVSVTSSTSEMSNIYGSGWSGTGWVGGVAALLYSASGAYIKMDAELA